MKRIKLMLAACGLAWAGAASAELPTDILAENKAAIAKAAMDKGEAQTVTRSGSDFYPLLFLQSLSNGDIVFSLDGNGNTNPANCERQNSFILKSDQSSYQLNKEILLMAFAMGTKLKLYSYSCTSGGQNKLAMIFMYR